MGLFGKKKAQPQQVQVPAQNIVKPWIVPPATKTYRIPAEHESTIYTYNGAPFRGLTANARFFVTAVPADVTLTSIYTGNTTSTSEYGDIAYSYNGIVFGFASSHASAIRKMMENGYTVEVEAYISGFDGEHGFPKIRGLFGFVDDSVYRSLE